MALWIYNSAGHRIRSGEDDVLEGIYRIIWRASFVSWIRMTFASE